AARGGREAQGAERGGLVAIGRPGERHRQSGDPERVPRRGRIAGFYGGDRSADEALEQDPYALVQSAVREGDGGLRGERGGEADEALRVGHRFALDLRG